MITNGFIPAFQPRTISISCGFFRTGNRRKLKKTRHLSSRGRHAGIVSLYDKSAVLRDIFQTWNVTSLTRDAAFQTSSLTLQI